MAVAYAKLLLWLENTNLAITIRQSSWLYPALEVMHILGIVVLAGAAFLFDFRLLGFSRDLSVKALANHLLPWSRRGLWLVVPSGFLLFMTGANELGYNFTFWLKMVLISLAGLNAWTFHKFTFQNFFAREASLKYTLIAKVNAVFSLILWLAVIVCGRWLAY